MRVAYISSYLPRKCGIATFTNDLTLAIDKLGVVDPSVIIAMTDPGQKYTYTDRVKMQINQFEILDYDKVVDYINNSEIDIVSLQHEYGLYSGPKGIYLESQLSVDDINMIESDIYLLSMLDKINKPIVTTFHSILSSPTSQQLYVAKRIMQSSSYVVAMTDISRQYLIDVYGCPVDKVVVISHGVPDFDFNHKELYRGKIGLKEESPIILASGLLGPGKELEYVIDAMSLIVKRIPQAKLLIVGQTHPVIIKNEGEAYRDMLTKIVHDKRLDNNVDFVNKYLDESDLMGYFQASDFFVTAYSNMQQSASGTLAWALGSGKICISTPYQYAKELLSDGSGVLIEPRSPSAIAESVIRLYDNPSDAKRICKKAYIKGHRSVWSNVAMDYVKLFSRTLQ